MCAQFTFRFVSLYILHIIAYVRTYNEYVDLQM